MMSEGPAMRFSLIWPGIAVWLLGSLLLACAPSARPGARATPPMTVEIALLPNERVQVTYALAKPAQALHFAQELGGYRMQDWHAQQPDFRWITEGTGERVERTDGKNFDRITFQIALRYRSLPKSYAPFSPFSEGSALIHSGQFHACIAALCEGVGPVPITIKAPGKTIGVEGRRVSNQTGFVSRAEGTNIFVGTLAPVASNGFVAIIDPGLPTEARDHLIRSLPRAVDSFAAIYGSLSFRPELYVSIDARRRADGHVSTQGGTLPQQIFMHFDGENARDRVAKGSPYWLDWFFAHEAAHLFQQDKVGKTAGEEAVAWIHEGGADAMAAIELAKRGDAERGYVQQRVREAGTACAAGLANMPLGQATARGQFDLHYQCGLLIWLALDGELRRAGQDGLVALNKAFFARVRRGDPWDQPTFLATAKGLTAPDALIRRIEQLNAGGYADAQAEVSALSALAAPL